MTEASEGRGRAGFRAAIVLAVAVLGVPCLLWAVARTERARLAVGGLVGSVWRGTVEVGAVGYEPPLRLVVSDLRLADEKGSEPWLVVPRLTLEPSWTDPFRRLGRVVLMGPRLRVRRTAAGVEPLDRLGAVAATGVGPREAQSRPPARAQTQPQTQPRRPMAARTRTLGQTPPRTPSLTRDPPSLTPPPLPVTEVRVREGHVVWVDEDLPLPLTLEARDVGLDLDDEDGLTRLHALADLGPLGRVEVRGTLEQVSGGGTVVTAATAGALGVPGAGSAELRLLGASLERCMTLLPEELRDFTSGVAGEVDLLATLTLVDGRVSGSSLRLTGRGLTAPLVAGASVAELLEVTVEGLHDPLLLHGSLSLRNREPEGGEATARVLWAREGPIVRLAEVTVVGRSSRVEGEGFLALERDGLMESLMAAPSFEVALRGGDVPVEGPGGQWLVRHLEARVVPGAVDVVRADLVRDAGRVSQMSGILALDGVGGVTGRLAGPDGAVVDVAGTLWQPTMVDVGEE